MCRYLARVVLVPFAYKPPNVRVDEMDTLMEMAPACIPYLINVVNTLSNTEPAIFYSMIDVINEALGETSIDPRLVAQQKQKNCYFNKKNLFQL